MENIIMLELGSTGNNVKILQEKLKILNYYAGPITGSFSSTTEDALINFQIEYNLDITGYVDLNTWNTLFEATTSPFPSIFRETKPTLKLGSTGEYVIELQKILAKLYYYNGNISGTFDILTQNAVKSFQLINKLTSDGIVGKDTWSALVYLYKPLAICGNEPVTIPSDTYIVKAGDTLYNIANKYDTTVDDIKSLNNLTTNNLSIGQILKIPNSSNTPTKPSNYDIYTVKAGDTLYAIANKRDTTVDNLKQINNLNSNLISIGQQLKVPKLTDQYKIYTVKKGDTLYNIAKTNNTTVDSIMTLNNLKNNTISIGQTLLLPN